MARKLVQNLCLVQGFVGAVFVSLMMVVNIHTFPPPLRILNDRVSQEYMWPSNTPAMHTGTSMTARQIVNRAYQETFADLKSFCPDNVDFSTCVLAKAGEQRTSRPWWFQTMLRDAAPPPPKMTKNFTKVLKKPTAKDSLFGEWHELYLMDPRMKICVMEKIGTKQWRKLQCVINQPLGIHGSNATTFCQPRPREKYNQYFKDATQVVFLRDPLERFLSAFLDKCWDSWHQNNNCKPREVFGSKSLADRTILQHEKTFFEAYVDTMPLKWDLHFFPQSFQCDGLYRHIKDYKFVGHMDANFYDHLETFGHKYNLSTAVEVVFHITGNKEKTALNVGVETSAANRVKDFYNARTVKRVLEYMAMDYVLLNLPIPSWVDEMLEKDL
jgi:Sulfotransferase family